MERGKKRLEKLRKRREKAVALFEQGERQAAVALHLRVSRQSVSEWWQAWHSGNIAALEGATRAGPKPKLEKEQLALVEKELLRGATAHGYATDLWSLPRVAQLISSVTGVSYHPGHVWRILRQMGWSLQRPTLKAKERDEEKITQWKTQRWEEVKKNASLWRAWVVFLDESGLSQKPPVRRTWAPRGKTPVLCHTFNWKKLSICAALGYRWDGKESRLFFRIVADSFNDEKLSDFLSQLRKEFLRKKVILVWDGLPSHRSRRMTSYLKQQDKWLTVVRLPAYAPELNPVESAWANIEGQELANRCADDLGGMVDGVRDGFSRIHSQSNSLPYSFLKHAGISFD